MNIADFLKEHGLTCRTPEEEETMLKALDKMYIEMTPSAAIKLVADYLENADEVYNDSVVEDDNTAQEKSLENDDKK